MVEAVTITLIVLVVLYFMQPSIKLMRLIYRIAIMSFKLKPVDLKTRYGEWAVVTGATDGVGKEFAKEFAKRDLNLVLISRSIEKLNKIKEEIQLLNVNIRIRVIDTDFSRGRFEFEKIRNQLKDIPVGILVNNVGAIAPPGNFDENSETELWEMINLNVAATTLMTHLVIEDMKTRKKGAIVNISCAIDSFPVPSLSVYSASKVFVRFFTDAVREEYSKHGITLQRLSPYYLNTKFIPYSSTVKYHKTICPNPVTYVRSAIETLGKLDSTTGFWIHECIKFFMSLFPIVLKKKLSSMYFYKDSFAYLQSLKKKVTEE